MASQSNKSSLHTAGSENADGALLSVSNEDWRKTTLLEAGLPPTYSPSNASFACVSLPQPYRIRFLQVSDDVVRSIHA